jgi:DNA polymerase-3 subunit epsilon
VPPLPAHNDWSSSLRCAVVDLETTGLKPDTDTILQVGVVHQTWGGHVASEWSRFIRPTKPLTSSLGPVEIHGIRRHQVLFAPRLERVMRRFADDTRGCIVVAHNAAFDVGFLRASARRVGIELDWAGTLCTLELSRRLGERGQANHRLATLCAEFGVDEGRAHDALHDARAAGRVLPHLLTRLGVDSDEALLAHVRA